MLSIKKVQVVPLEINNGTIIDSFNTQDDHHTNAPSLNAVEDKLNNKADKSTTLSGYGITDAYTKTESDNNYQPKVLSGTSNPSSNLGNNGDIYLQYS